MILRLPEGYDTRLVGNVVSAGQRQRIGIAPAFYGEPALIVLDERSSNLDQEGDAALARTLTELKRTGRTVVVVTHRRNVLQQADRILLMAEGQLAVYGDRDKVLATLRQAAARESGAAAARPVTLAPTAQPAE